MRQPYAAIPGTSTAFNHDEALVPLAHRQPGSRLARWGIYGLTALASLMVGTVAYVLMTGEERGRVPSEPEAPTAELKNPPVLVFPERLRTFDISLNRFIDRFIRATLEERYNDFRQMWTRRLDPVGAEKYLRIWKVVREVRVLDVQPVRAGDGGGIEAYLIAAEVRHDAAEAPRRRNPDGVRWIRAVREGEDWVFAPPEKSDRERVYGAAATQASEGEARG